MEEYENKRRVKCKLSYTDPFNSKTTFRQNDGLYREHELAQLAEYFKRFVNAIGYEWVDEVQIIKYKNDISKERIYSSEC